MKALIIAAGNGTRMQPVTKGRHKSLMPLLGLRIIERVILGAKEANILEFVIVTGYKSNTLRKFVGNGRKYGVSIKYINNSDWEKANGISALLAKKYLKENFALLMSDHVFDPKTLIRIQKLKLKINESVLAVDQNMDNVLDVDDTTKVLVTNKTIFELDKKLDTYNGYDTGMFICSPYIFKILSETTGKGKNSLSDGMRVLVSKKLLKAFDVKGSFWSDCDTWEDIQFAQKKLLKSLTKPGDGIVSKVINRKVSTFFSKYIINTFITPNMISVAILAMAIPTFFLLSTGSYPWLIIGGVSIQMMSIFDGIDGEIARMKFIESSWGGFLDANLDKYVDTTVVAGMTLGYLNNHDNLLIIPIALFVIFGLGLDGYMPNKFEVMTGEKLPFGNLNFLNMKRDSRLLTLALGAIFNQIILSFLILLFFYHLMVIIRMYNGKLIIQKLVFSSK